MKVSIIIPVYNVSLYIERCIYSVLRQSYEDLECVIVNDDSQDDSMKKVHDILFNQDTNTSFTIVSHPFNQGLSAARNTGVKNSIGEYIYFLDSDDEITPDCIEKLVSYLNNLYADIVVGELSVIGENRIKYSPLSINDNTCLNGNEIIDAFLRREWYEMAWNKLVNRKMFFEKGCWFREGIVHEDNLWSFYVALKSQTMIVSRQTTYLYYINPGTITSKKQQKHFDSMLIVMGEMIETWNANEALVNRKLLCDYLMNLKLYFIKKIITSDCDKLYVNEKLLQLFMLFRNRLFDNYHPTLADKIKYYILRLLIKYSQRINCN